MLGLPESQVLGFPLQVSPPVYTQDAAASCSSQTTQSEGSLRMQATRPLLPGRTPGLGISGGIRAAPRVARESSSRAAPASRIAAECPNFCTHRHTAPIHAHAAPRWTCDAGAAAGARRALVVIRTGTPFLPACASCDHFVVPSPRKLLPVVPLGPRGAVSARREVQRPAVSATARHAMRCWITAGEG